MTVGCSPLWRPLQVEEAPRIMMENEAAAAAAAAAAVMILSQLMATKKMGSRLLRRLRIWEETPRRHWGPW